MNDNIYRKRTQKDYTMSFKLSVVSEVEKGELTYKQAQLKYGIQGRSTVLVWLRKYGNFDWTDQTPSNMPKSPEQKLLELEQKLRQLEKQNNRLKAQAAASEKKAILFDMMIDLAEKEYNIPIKKKLQNRVIDMFVLQKKESISSTCKLLGFSRQVYYQANYRVKKSQSIANKVVELVKRVRMEQPRIGTRKLYYLLSEELSSLAVGRDRLFDILRANKLLIKRQKSYHITTNSHHRFRKHTNLIENLEINRPEQVWVADITYLGNRKNPMYLSLITDAYSKKIIGYHLDKTLEVSSTVKALEIAMKNRVYPEKELIHHSDRGLQYCSNIYQNILSKHNIKCSMTESYDPYQNAIAERVNGILKQEFFIATTNLDIKIMKKIVKQSITIYNSKRPHWSCHFKTPNQAHQQNKMKIKSYRKKTSSKAIALDDV
ncbi:IS3 family transposase [Tenacibaculum sp. ZS6-P6]|uniref:IS3 family transposase n=1 Tax=Tenacibaculum sp. ZS6-P6 TaxID=3447503 RepID=UPI003F9CEBE6